MKKSLIILISLLTAVSVTACSFGSDNNTSAPQEDIIETSDIAQADERDYDIALITDEKGIDDTANLDLWKSVIAYGDSNCKTYKYYAAGEESDSAALITEAVERNAKIVVLPDSSYKNTVLELQDSYSDVCFLLVDTQPDEDFADNVHCVKFKEEQTGYLAGYLLVMEGYKSLGFVGDGSNDKNKRYLYGMVQGADDATQELRLHDITIKYKFIKPKEDKAKDISKKMYKDGIEVIFTCNETITNAAAKSAKDAKKKIICGERVYGGSENVCLASIEYDVVKAVDFSIKSSFDSDLGWVVGKENKDLNLGVESECINIPDDEESFKFKTVTPGICRGVIEKLANGEISVSDKTSKPAIAAVVYSEF